jgi:6-pyruvoyltetrahydropterin/6-carboxytetrahydropterin synthase
MFELKVVADFAAAHQLRNFEGNCEKLHGHNWKVEVTLCGEKLNKAGLLMDFREIKDATDRVLKELDHSFLNDLPPFKHESPSSENIAAYLYGKLSNELNTGDRRVSKVTAWESDSACASYAE